jgi:cell division transport system permease protein
MMSNFRAKRESKNQGKRGAQYDNPNGASKPSRVFAQHSDVANDCLRQLLSSPIATFMTVLVLAVALALPSFLFTTLNNLSRMTNSWDNENKISLYLQHDLSAQQVDNFVQTLLIRPDLMAIDLVDADQGLLEFKQFSGFANIIDQLSENPLPAVVSILAKDNSVQGLESLKSELANLEIVEQAVLDLDWIKRFNGFVLVIERVVISLSVLLAFAVLLIIGNTIRLNVESRREEILVSKLMGATNAWVRRPFLYAGVFYGLMSALLAWLIIELSLLVMHTPVLHLSQLYQSGFALEGLGVNGTLILTVVGLALGLTGALISVNKFLKQLEPK